MRSSSPECPAPGGRFALTRPPWCGTSCTGRAVDRRLVKLEAVRFGSTWFTSVAAVTRFLAALSGTAPPADGGGDAAPGQAAHATARPSPGRRRKRSEKAEQTLIAAGF